MGVVGGACVYISVDRRKLTPFIPLTYLPKPPPRQTISPQTKEMVSSTAYNWIRPSLWTAIFGGKQALVGGSAGTGAGAAAGAPLAGH